MGLRRQPVDTGRPSGKSGRIAPRGVKERRLQHCGLDLLRAQTLEALIKSSLQWLDTVIGGCMGK